MSTNAIAPRIPTGLAALLEKYKGQIQVALGPQGGMTADRLIRVSLTAVSQNPKLGQCNPLTICGAIVQAATLGLEPSSVLGECFLVPFYNKKANGGEGGMEAQLVVGYQGKIKLVANTGDLMGVKASPVREHDEFEFDDGLEPFVRHKYFHIKDRGGVVGYWAGARLKNGFTSIVFMTKTEVEKHRDEFALTKDKNGKIIGVWVDNFDAMALKTVIHKCLKYIPKSTVAQTAWALDEQAEAGVPQKYSIEVPFELQQTVADEQPQPKQAQADPEPANQGERKPPATEGAKP